MHLRNIESYFGLISIFVSFWIFFILNRTLNFILPKAVLKTDKEKWKWKNIMISLIHSVVAGLWAVICFILFPEMAEDLINSYSTFAHMLVSFSVGYFLHDLMDLSLNYRNRSSYELIIHHCFVIVCFGLSIMTTFYIGYAVVSLLVEINSIFLHSRQLFNIVGTQKSDFTYRLNSLMNIFTFIIFRIAVLGWMTRWLVLHRSHLSLPVYTLGSVGLAVIILMNIVLFIRICSTDFSNKRKTDTKPSELRASKISKEEMMNSASSNTFFANTQNFHLD
ncbi:UNVERIFIED_CONTAM: hypothetical protein RMT77_006689 [Armadillidium vulgare]